ncbi:MAG: ribbon-helix-helix protein, CopG family [Proteobacteria bacterium]|nr:ribbon-helix-helix protein, CopG family [Pseudomonadota bacterium]
MVRTQIQLTEKQAVALKRLAAKKRVSMAELIRVGVNKLLHSVETVSLEERRQRAIAIAGRFRSSRSDLSTKHDEHLAEIY